MADRPGRGHAALGGSGSFATKSSSESRQPEGDSHGTPRAGERSRRGGDAMAIEPLVIAPRRERSSGPARLSLLLSREQQWTQILGPLPYHAKPVARPGGRYGFGAAPPRSPVSACTLRFSHDRARTSGGLDPERSRLDAVGPPGGKVRWQSRGAPKASGDGQRDRLSVGETPSLAGWQLQDRDRVALAPTAV